MTGIWQIALKYPGKTYYIKTKNPQKTLAKIAKKQGIEEIAIHPPNHYYWHIITPQQLSQLLGGEEIETTIALHYPPSGGEGYGAGSLQLPSQ